MSQLNHSIHSYILFVRFITVDFSTMSWKWERHHSDEKTGVSHTVDSEGKKSTFALKTNIYTLKNSFELLTSLIVRR